LKVKQMKRKQMKRTTKRDDKKGRQTTAPWWSALLERRGTPARRSTPTQ
jgi:hypothetical protein